MCVLRLYCCLYMYTHACCGRRPRRPTFLFFNQNSILFWKFFCFTSSAGKGCLLSVCLLLWPSSRSSIHAARHVACLRRYLALPLNVLANVVGERRIFCF
ncbi:unnamed protein product [Ectocarpus sp. 12 AP-2014]